MTLMKRNPLSELEQLQNRLSSLFTDAFGPSPRDEEFFFKGNWAPVVDIEEDAEAITLHAELPGINKEDINVKVEDRVLTISGERKFEHEEKRDHYQRIERAYGKFSRSFSLNKLVDTNKILATYKDGVLTIRLPKAEEVKPKQISVNIA